MANPARKAEFNANQGVAAGTSTTMSTTLPTGLANGDTAVFCMELNSGTATATPPAGWQLLFGPIYNSNNFATYVWVKDLTAADSGTTVVFTSSNALRLVGVGQVWTGTSATEILAGQHPSPNVVTGSGTSLTAPSFSTARTTSGVCQLWCIRDASAGGPVATITAPAGHTLGTSTATAYPTAPNFRLQSSYRSTTAAGSYGGQTVTASEAVNYTAYSIEIPEATGSPPPPPVISDQLGYVGDSLTFQAGSDAVRQSLILAGWPSSNLRVDGVVGRPIPDGAVLPTASQVINSWRADGFDPATWVIALGSNNFGSTPTQWTTWIKEKIDQIAAGPRAHYTLFWVGLALRRDPAPTDANMTDANVSAFQTVINGLVGYNAKVTFVPLDWNAHVHNGRDETGLWQGSDTSGRHMTPAGYNVRNSFVASQVKPTPGPAPTASFTPSVMSGDAPLAVTFTDTSTDSPTAWAWTFGDGGTASTQNPSHTFTNPGTYSVQLTASNAGGSSSVTRTITATDPAAPTTGLNTFVLRSGAWTPTTLYVQAP